ncbi:hypothetical protein sm9_0210 [Methanobrevibacter millerae]|uniref:Uncharacterized protein n=1 Tax=Methanobrevibacter millerae TaxID=230361 RepID=A0A0U2V0G2_9EURY|nr:hypothetical protein sm9_0210 [Methanobrevibacter millerae]
MLCALLIFLSPIMIFLPCPILLAIAIPICPAPVNKTTSFINRIIFLKYINVVFCNN